MASNCNLPTTYDEGDLRWLAGLFDGRGAFSIDVRDGHWRPLFYYNTVRRDLLLNIERVLGFGSVRPRNAGPQAKQQQYRYEIATLAEFVIFQNLVARFMRTSKREEFEATRSRARIRNERARALESRKACGHATKT